jgi:hypothetical protein
VRPVFVLCCAVLCCAVLCCAVLCCAVLYCTVLCCAVLYCAVLCCAVLALVGVLFCVACIYRIQKHSLSLAKPLQSVSGMCHLTVLGHGVAHMYGCTPDGYIELRCGWAARSSSMHVYVVPATGVLYTAVHHHALAGGTTAPPAPCETGCAAGRFRAPPAVPGWCLARCRFYARLVCVTV